MHEVQVHSEVHVEDAGRSQERFSSTVATGAGRSRGQKQVVQAELKGWSVQAKSVNGIRCRKQVTDHMGNDEDQTALNPSTGLV